MHILLFGISSNPPHLGHLLVIQQAFELIPNIDELWLVPTYADTFHKSLAPTSHRLVMSQLLLESLAPSPTFTQVKLCPIDLDITHTSHTFDTLQALKSNQEYLVQHKLIHHSSFFPPHFSFLIGSDQLASFHKWGHYQELIKLLPFFVYPRAGFPDKPLYPNMTLLKSPTQVITNLSSTLIRQRIQQSLSLTNLVPPAIITYLIRHNLYHN